MPRTRGENWRTQHSEGVLRPSGKRLITVLLTPHVFYFVRAQATAHSRSISSYVAYCMGKQMGAHGRRSKAHAKDRHSSIDDGRGAQRIRGGDTPLGSEHDKSQ